MNTLDLDPEWGAIDLFEEVEASFGIKIEDAVAEQIETVGDLYDAICDLTPEWDDQQGSCASSVIFYRMRRALVHLERKSVSPRMDLPLHGTTPSKLFSLLERETGLRLPSAPLTTLGVIGWMLFLIGIIGGVIALFDTAWELAAGGAVMAAVGAALLKVDPGSLPVGVETLGDLVSRAVPLNAQKLADVGARLPDRWTMLTGLASEHGILSPAEISPDTFLHLKSLKIASRSA
jgi:hypothetical protein